MSDEVVVYGSNWCGYTQRTLRVLDVLKVDYRYVDVDLDPAAEQHIAGWNNGRAIRPTLDLQGDVFVNPDRNTLADELEKRGLLASQD